MSAFGEVSGVSKVLLTENGSQNDLVVQALIGSV